MNSSEYNSTRTEGEPIVGSGIGAANAKPARAAYSPVAAGVATPRQVDGQVPAIHTDVFPDPDPHNRGSVEAVAERAARERARESGTAKQQMMGLLAGDADIDVRDTHAEEVLETRDPFGPRDAEGNIIEEEAKPAFDKYRYRGGHTLEAPEALQLNTHVDPDVLASTVRDLGIAAKASDISAEAAQSLLSIIGEGYQPPRREQFDLDEGLSEIRLLAGADTDKLIASAQKYVAKHPALAAFLEDGPALGNHPKVVAALGLLGQYPELATREGAEGFLAKLKVPNSELQKAYFSGHRLTVMAATLAHGVVASSEKS